MRPATRCAPLRQGILIGDGLVDPYHQYPSYVKFARTHQTEMKVSGKELGLMEVRCAARHEPLCAGEPAACAGSVGAVRAADQGVRLVEPHVPELRQPGLRRRPCAVGPAPSAR